MTTLVSSETSSHQPDPVMDDPAVYPLVPDLATKSFDPLTGHGELQPSSRSVLPDHIKSHLIGGTSALGLGTAVERGAGFLANILAARFAGASNFGAYSLAITTANNISTYAAGGIGATAARFSGKYPYGSRGYPTLARALIVVSICSALLAATGLWLGAGPIAHLLGKPELTPLLRWAVLSTAGIILLECARGFFVGQRRLIALLSLSVLAGGGMLTLLPIAARMHSPIKMIVSQGVTTVLAVAVCLTFSRRLGLRAISIDPLGAAPDTGGLRPLGPMLREVWSFGGVQLAGLIGSNLAGWWLTTLVARDDSSLVQISFFAIASQWRNLTGMAPSLLTEGSYAFMSDPEGETSATPHRVMALCSFASLAASLTIAAVGIVLVPWLLTLLYGQAYRTAAATVAIALAIAVVHMGNAPAAARLTIVSIRATGVINTLWAVFVGVTATIVLLHKGTADQAMCIYFVAHVLSSTLVLLALRWKDHVPPGLGTLLTVGVFGSGSLAALALLRDLYPRMAFSLTGLMVGVMVLLAGILFLLGQHYRWLPSASALRRIVSHLRDTMGRRTHHV